MFCVFRALFSCPQFLFQAMNCCAARLHFVVLLNTPITQLMKKIFLFALLATAGLKSYAQLAKGRVLVGLDLGFNKRDIHSYSNGLEVTRDQATTNFAGLRAGYFISSQTALGLSSSYMSGISKFAESNGQTFTENKTTTIGFGVWERSYQMLGKSGFAVFGQVQFSYSKSDGKTEITGGNQIPKGSTETTTTLDLGLRPGLVYFWSPVFSFETSFGSIGYQSANRKSYDNLRTLLSSSFQSSFYSNFSANLSFLTFGLTFYFGETTAAPETARAEKQP
jgi:hypothetical protein